MHAYLLYMPMMLAVLDGTTVRLASSTVGGDMVKPPKSISPRRVKLLPFNRVDGVASKHLLLILSSSALSLSEIFFWSAWDRGCTLNVAS